MTHAYYLRILEAEIDCLPVLYIAPVWAHIETLEATKPVDTPYPGLDGIAFRFVYDLIGQIDARLGSTRRFMGLADITQQAKRMIETHQALAELPMGAPYGAKCAAWAEAFHMGGVIVDRSPDDPNCQAVRLSRRVRATVDDYIAAWTRRHADGFSPILHGEATSVRILQPACAG